MNFGIATVASITVLSYLMGMTIRASGLGNKWIPVLCGLFGTVLGILALLMGMPDFPASDCLTAAAVGAVSGLAATGADQAFRQLQG